MFKFVILLSVAALSAAKPYGATSISQYSTSVVHGSPYVAPVAHVVAPVAVAPVAPVAVHPSGALIDAVHGVPLDTPEVAVARAQHFAAKAYSLHHLKKRSLVAPVVSSYSPVAYSAPVVSAYGGPVVSYHAPLTAYSPYVSAYTSQVVVPKAYGVHPW